MTVETAQAPAPRPRRARARPSVETELSLLLDVGTAWTKAALVGRAGGRWRIVSGTAQPTAWGESVLVEDLVSRLAAHADARLSRRLPLLVREAPRITCRSPARAGRLAIVAETAAGRDAAVAVARRSGWMIGAVASADDGRGEAGWWQLLRDVGADGWLLVATGHVLPPGGPLWGVAAAARGRANTPVFVIGPETAGDAFAETFGDAATWVADAVDAHLHDVLLNQLRELSGLDEPRTMAPLAFGRAMAALRRGLGIGVLGVDLGASWTAWASATAEGAATSVIADAERRILRSSVRGDGARAAAEILPEDVDEFTTTDAVANLAAHPSALPASAAEAGIAQAVGIDRLAAVRRAMGRPTGIDLLVGSGRLISGAPHAADAAMILLDGLRPEGVTQLAIDPWGICAPLGALADGDVDEGMETLRDDLLVPLGTAIVSSGGRPGQVAFRARLRRPGWPDSPAIELRSGGLAVLPLERGGRADLEVELERGVQLGMAHRGRRLRAPVTGGSVGVILDARDDPIQLPSRPGDARTMVESWRDALRRESRPAGA